MPDTRKPIRDLDRKLVFLQRSPLAQQICGHTGTQNSFATALGIARETLRDSIRDLRMSDADQAVLARRCDFDLLWPEWNDVEGKQRDKADSFTARYIQHHSTSTIPPPAPQLIAAQPDPRQAFLQDPEHSPPPAGSKNPTLEQFIAELDLARVSTVSIFATTGKVTVSQLLVLLQDAAKRGLPRPVRVEILLNAAYMSDAGRPAGIVATMQTVKQFQVRNPAFQIDVRSYSSAPVFRGAIIEHTDGSFSGHLGYYYWGHGNEHSNRSHWHRHGVAIPRSQTINPFLQVFHSWFRHYWAQSIINTLIFDFDDTIFATTDAQVHGWLAAIQRATIEGIITPENLLPAYRHLAKDTPTAFTEMRELFLDGQTESRIMQSLFGPLPDKAKRFIRAVRLEVREALTESDSVPIQVVLNDIKDLSRTYRLIVVSAASEDMVHRVLLKHDIGVFSYVFGRNPARLNQEWREIDTKSQIFIRLSSMLGVPLERMIFVGDSDADYRAARRLGIPFIENVFNAKNCGRASLIKNPEGEHHVISGRTPGELTDCVKKIERQIAARWSNL